MSLRWSRLTRVSAGEVEKGWDAEHHAADHRHDNERKPTRRADAQAVNEPDEKKHEKNCLRDEHQPDMVGECGMKRCRSDKGIVEKEAVGNDEAKQCQSQEQLFLCFGKGVHAVRRMCEVAPNIIFGDFLGA